jgi:Tol biopolymer transport system component
LPSNREIVSPSEEFAVLSLSSHIAFLSLILFGALLTIGCGSQDSLGIFQAHQEVGTVKHAGAVHHVPEKETYTISGSGENMWGARDAFHFAWKEVSGDLSLAAEVNWQGKGEDPHRKAGWMIRQDSSEDSPYVDAVVHGDGLISLQYRTEKGGETREIQAPNGVTGKLLLERHGDVFSLAILDNRENEIPVGAIAVPLQDPVLAGLAVCSHNPEVVETAEISSVRLNELGVFEAERRQVESSLEIVTVESGRRRLVHRSTVHFEAPNWSRDGAFLLFNQQGSLYTIPVEGGEPDLLDTQDANQCNNDHGFSPDGKMLAISHSPEGQSLIYTLPATGGKPKLITPNGPSYWHGWSPDGSTLAYCAERDGEYDIYTIPVGGGKEKRLTTAEGLDDGPDYSSDGQFIYFNSVRSGLMKIWRMRADGSEQTQITTDSEYGDWFPHPSPDNSKILWVSYDKSVEGHPANQNVVLRLMTLPDGGPRVLVTLFGGQGTINVPSWSPDSTEVAFVSYRLVGNR